MHARRRPRSSTTRWANQPGRDPSAYLPTEYDLRRFAARSRRDRLPLVSEDRVRVRIADNGVATVTMVRADKHNALDQAMFEGLVAAAEQLAGDTSVRAVVLHGEGKSFCSGLDVASFMGGERGTGVLLDRDEDRPANLAQRVSYDWSLVPAPVIASIHGNCFGGGLQIALGADIRVAAPDAKLSIMEIKWGLVPDMGITQTLPRLLPIDVAKELTFTGRIFSGSEGSDLGLITRIAADPLSAALALAGEIALKSPDAVRAAKRLYNETWTSSDPAAALARESVLQTGLIGTPNQIAAVVAGMSGERPVFADPA
jgi:enoyl-CoA hydratase/carnithine racemase